MTPTGRITDGGGEVAVAGFRITRCCFDYATTLLIAGDHEHYELRLETEFSLSVDGRVHRVDPEDHSTVAIVLSLFNNDVARAHIFGSGALSTEFTKGDALGRSRFVQ